MKWLRISLALFCLLNESSAFVPSQHSSLPNSNRLTKFDRRYQPLRQQRQQRLVNTRKPKSSSTSLYFMGSEGGILGVGAPEVVTILLVGYFILGPSDLYKVVKEIGKFIQNFRTLGADLSKTVESNFESQLQLEEIRKAQRELNDAFNFRRTINVDEDSQAFSTGTDVGKEKEAPSSEEASAPKKKKKIRKRLKKRVEEPEPALEPAMAATADSNSGVVEDLDMTSAFTDNEEEITLREERMERLKESGNQQDSSWISDTDSPVPLPPSLAGTTTTDDLDQKERFAQQMSENWNKQIMENEDKLSPLAQIMERLAILEEEKNVADERLEEEFRLRAELEEKYYKEKRSLLEEAAAQVQSDVYTSISENNNATTTAEA